MKTRLTIELVPSTCWFSNVRSEVSSADWDRLKRMTSAAANRRCELCGGRGLKWPVECHEVWEYDDELWLQTLVRLIALCPACHEVKHIGLAETRGRLKPATQWLAKINGWSYEDSQLYVAGAFEQWARRSSHPWSLDLSYLEQYNIQVKRRNPIGQELVCKTSNGEFNSHPALQNPKPLPL